MSKNSIQLWLGFLATGLALFGTGMMTALPTDANLQYAALGVLMTFASGIGMVMTSPQMLELAYGAEQRIATALGR